MPPNPAEKKIKKPAAGFYSARQRKTLTTEASDQFYTTQRWIGYACANLALAARESGLASPSVLDFSAGDGRFCHVLETMMELGKVYQFDINPTDEEVVRRDFFEVELEEKVDIVGFNPPFGHRGHIARRFITHAAQTLKPTLMALIVPYTQFNIIPKHYKIVHEQTLTDAFYKKETMAPVHINGCRLLILQRDMDFVPEVLVRPKKPVFTALRPLLRRRSEWPPIEYGLAVQIRGQYTCAAACLIWGSKVWMLRRAGELFERSESTGVRSLRGEVMSMQCFSVYECLKDTAEMGWETLETLLVAFRDSEECQREVHKSVMPTVRENVVHRVVKSTLETLGVERRIDDFFK